MRLIDTLNRSAGVVPHTHGRRQGCCPLHMVTGAFSPDRSPILASAEAGAAPPPSILDSTPKERSRHCTQDRSATASLYESIGPGRALVFRNARVVTMRATEVLASHDVIVCNGRIEAVVPSGGALPAEAIVVEAMGKTLIPGLSDIHSHLFVSTWAGAFAPLIADGGDGSQYLLPYDLVLFLMLANGITRVEIMAGCPDTLWMRDSVRDGSLVGPRLSVGSPLVDGSPAFHSPTMSYIVGDLEGGRRAGELIADMGYDFAKPYTNLPATGFEGLVQVCERRGVRLMGHVPAKVGIEAAVKRGQQGIAHVAEFFYNEMGPERYDAARRDRLARLMADAGTWLQATVVVSQRMEWMGGGTLDAPDAAWMNPLQKGLWADSSPLLSTMRSAPEKRQFIDNMFELSILATRAAREAGVRILTGTDFPNPYVVEGFSLHEELVHLTSRCGLTNHEALHASTRRAAEYHGEGPADGLVAAGGRADLVLLDADPLVDINATRRIDCVLVGNSLLRRSAIDEGLARIRKRYAAMPEAKVQLPQMHAYSPRTQQES